LGISSGEHFMREISENGVQKPGKRRTRADKIGRMKYNQQLLKQVLAEVKDMRHVQRIILHGLKGAGYFQFGVPMLEKFACQDQVDLEILEAVREAGPQGAFPKDIAKQLSHYGLEYYHVSRRILRMNRRLESETGERLFEKRGWKWALTSFALEVWGEENGRAEHMDQA
jgi:hypothetical protein